MSATKNVEILAVTAGQVRAARALLGWSRPELAAASGIPTRTIDRLETGEATKPRQATMRRIVSALARAGIEFIPPNGGGPGVRLTREAALREAVARAKGE